MRSIKVYTSLSYAGALPFIACAALTLAGVTIPTSLPSIIEIAASYCLVIVAFMAGTHWAGGVANSPGLEINLFLSSVSITLAAWFAYLLTSPRVSISVAILAFIALLWIDCRLHTAQRLSHHYWIMRRNVSAIVIITLVLMVLFE